MNQQRHMFRAALQVLNQRAQDMLPKLDNELSDSPDDHLWLSDDDMEAFDEALGIVMDTRNKYCAEAELAIEDGTIKWADSELMKQDAIADEGSE